jgi:hypothetical protein
MNQSLQQHQISLEVLRQRVPSVFAQTAHESRSKQYGFVPTEQVIRGLLSQGFYAVAAQQSNSRDEDRIGHAKHMLRFRRDESPIDGLVPEVVLVNSHDGSSAYKLIAGLFRFVCFNGLVLSDKFESVAVMHRKDQVSDIIEGSFRVIAEARKGIAQAREMSEMQLSEDEQLLLATSVHQERFGATSSVGSIITAQQMLTPKRVQDKRTDLFTVLNRLQEHAIGGGLRGWDRGVSRGYRRVSMRKVTGIDQTVELNRKIWGFGEQMLALKAA